jgi:hypothetical protein
MMDPRPAGLVIAILGVVGTAIAALADPLGIGEGETFGWLQLTGVILGGIVILLGLVIAMEWVPYPGRARDDTVVAGGPGGQNTTIVSERRSDPEVVETRTDRETVTERRTDPEPR